MPHLKKETESLQEAFADYCRSGREALVPAGVPHERAAVYRRLVYNVVQETLSHSYPIARRLLRRKGWAKLVNTFFAQHPCSSPLLWRMAKELYLWVREEGVGERMGMPYLADLLLLEWLEIEVYMMPDGVVPSHREEGDVWQEVLVVNPDQSLNTFEYPVFRERADKLEALKGRYYLTTYRHPDTLKVGFMELSPSQALVMELLKREPMTGGEVFELAAIQFGKAFPEQAGRSFLEAQLRHKTLLGFQTSRG